MGKAFLTALYLTRWPSPAQKRIEKGILQDTARKLNGRDPVTTICRVVCYVQVQRQGKDHQEQEKKNRLLSFEKKKIAERINGMRPRYKVFSHDWLAST